MHSRSFSRRDGWRSAAAILALVFLFAGAACGKKEGSGSGAGAGVPSTGISPSASEGTGQLPAPSGEGEQVIVDPMIPCRTAPLGISFGSTAGGSREILGVRWIVNGMEGESGLRLPPTGFRRGDKIRAAVTLRVGGEERLVETPEVTAGNSPPTASAVRIEPAALVSGGTVRAIVETRDADEDSLKVRFQWYIDNVPVSGDADRLDLKGAKRGAWVHVAAIPNDGFCDGAWIESSRHQVANALPVVKSDVPKEVPPGRNFVYRIAAEDPDGDPLTYTLAKGPPGMVLNGPTLEWPISEAYFGQPVEVVVEISDGHGGRTVQNISMTIQPPRKSGENAPQGKEGK